MKIDRMKASMLGAIAFGAIFLAVAVRRCSEPEPPVKGKSNLVAVEVTPIAKHGEPPAMEMMGDYVAETLDMAKKLERSVGFTWTWEDRVKTFVIITPESTVPDVVRQIRDGRPPVPNDGK